MAVVVPKPPTNISNALRAENNGNNSMIWTATSRTNALIATEMTGRKEKTDWTKDYLGAAFAADQDHMESRHRVFGIGSPKPLGIVTFEDIIDVILQKTSKDEKDFFDRKTSTPPTKGKKSGDYRSNAEPSDVIQHSPVASPHVPNPHTSLENPKRGGTLRQRKPSKNERATGGMDGVDEYSLDTLNDCSSKPLNARYAYVSSSYTQDSQGGFHGRDGSATTLDYAMVFNTEELTHLANTSSSDCPGNPYSPVKTVSLPTRKSRTGTMSEGLKQTPRHVSAAPILPTLCRVTPFSRQNYSSFERQAEREPGTRSSDLVLPILSTDPVDPEESFNANRSGFDMENSNEQNLSSASEHHSHNSGDTITLSSWYGERCNELSDEDCTHIYDAFPVPPSSRPGENIAVMKSIEEEPKPYDGFPPELLDNENKENRLPKYASKTLPRLVPSFDFERTAGRASGETLVREKSFHDDRALLPSQRRALENNSNYSGMRSTSFWF
jgi:metal transporter CNNM